MKLPSDLRTVPSPSSEGEDWIYWDPKAKRFRRVELSAVPAERPQRVRVQHLDTDMGARAEWVPTGRLHTPWAGREAYFEAVAAEKRLESHAPPAWQTDLASLLLAEYIRPEFADSYANGAGGVLQVTDIRKLADIARLSVGSVTAHPDSVEDAGTWYLPWTTFEEVIISLVRHNPEPAMRLLDEQTRGHQDFDLLVDSQGERWWMDRNESGVDARRIRKWHTDDLGQTDLLRRWLDQGAPSLAESYVQLRGMYAELVDAAREAVPRVRMSRSQISDRIADRVEELLARPTPLVDLRGFRKDRVYEGPTDDF